MSALPYAVRDAFAQGPLLPAVSIRTIAGATGEVWPADFNGDGLTDLVTRIGTVAVLLGAGDGTFSSPVLSSTAADVLTVGDLDADGRRDVVAVIKGQGAIVLPGNGNGTLGAPRPIVPGPSFAFASAVDIDNDGHRDVVVGGEHETDEGLRDVLVVPGNGDLTFDAPVPLAFSGDRLPYGHTVADLNADRLPDIAIANRELEGVSIYLNDGNLTFDMAVVDTVFASASDITARDVTADGRVDLLVSTRNFGDHFNFWGDGAVEVFAGNGDGTFVSRGTFPTAYGTESVVVGDFTRDGKLDVATSNRSHWFSDNFMCGASLYQDTDTLSILEGLGDGTFKAPVSFALGTLVAPGTLQRMAGTVNTADLNGDGHTDLLVAPGRVVLNQAPRTNRPPVVNAGPDLGVTDHEVRLRGTATDPDHHWLKVEWSEGSPVPPGSNRYRAAEGCEFLPGIGTYTYYLNADDRHGGVASDDLVVRYPPHDAPTVTITSPAAGAAVTEGTPTTVRWDVTNGNSISWFYLSLSTDGGANYTRLTGDCEIVESTARQCAWTSPAPATTAARLRITIEDTYYTGTFESGLFAIRPGSQPLPPGWSNRDIGNVAAPGRVSIGENTYTVTGSGADIWGTADEFHYLHRAVTGDFQIDAQVLSVANINQWTKAGLMIRAGTAAQAAHASIFATPTSVKGIAFQRRPAAGGTSVHTAGDPRVPPVWLRLIRQGNTVFAYLRPSASSTWEFVGQQVFASLPQTVEAGLAVSSHVDGTLASATFGSVTVSPLGTPDDWSNHDVGPVAAAGGASFDGTRHTVHGSGADIWGTGDEFHFVHQLISGDFQIEARVLSVEHVDVWTKAGLMIREDMAPGSKHASIFATPTTVKGIAFQRRPANLATSVHTAGPPLTAPVWLRLVRSGNTVSAFYRQTETEEWQPMSATQTFSSLPGAVQVGLAVTSHADGTLATAVFDRVRILPAAPADPGEPVGTTPFRTLDVGDVGLTGHVREEGGGTVTLQGAGADIWGTADAFRFMYQRLEGDWDIEAAVNQVSGLHAWTKAGVMIRETLTPGSRHAFALVSQAKGVAFQYRSATGGVSSQAAQVAGTAPHYVRLTRRGSEVTAYMRTAGTAWQTLGTRTIPMGTTVYVGLALTSHDAAWLASAEFADIIVRRP